MKSLDEILKLENPSKYLYEHAYKNGQLKSKWEKLLLLLGDPFWLYRYTRYVIKDRWPEAEEYIKKSPEWAYWYTYHIIKGRWEEAEEYIKKTPRWAYYYARHIIKRKWFEAEEYIKKNPYWWIEYYRNIYR